MKCPGQANPQRWKADYQLLLDAGEDGGGVIVNDTRFLWGMMKFSEISDDIAQHSEDTKNIEFYTLKW